MTHKQREQIFKEIFNKAKKIRETKGIDYALGSEDVNHNFKSVAKVLGLSPEQVLWVYYLKHNDAITHFIKKGHLKGEGIEEKIIDNINYLGILLSLIREDENIQMRKNK